MGILVVGYFALQSVLDHVIVELKAQAVQVPVQLSCLSRCDATAL
jgi:hypothetical protein